MFVIAFIHNIINFRLKIKILEMFLLRRNVIRTTFCRLQNDRLQLRAGTKFSNNASPDNKTESRSLKLSDSCRKRLNEISSSQANKLLRVVVDGGGCSGFQYKFQLDDKINDDDLVFGNESQKIVIDSISLDYCDGATIDYQTELIKSGFRIVDNPKAEQGCSCGASFALKID